MSQKSSSQTNAESPAHDAMLGEQLGLAVAGSASWRYVLLFGTSAAVLLSVYYFPYSTGSTMRNVLDSYLRGYATMAGAVLRLVEPNLVVSGQDIIGRYSIRIVRTCDAMDVNVLLTSAIMAWPCALRPRLIATASGLALLVVANTARICTLYYVGVYAPSSFEFVHMELWPAVILAIAVVLFLTFISKVRPHATT